MISIVRNIVEIVGVAIVVAVAVAVVVVVKLGRFNFFYQCLHDYRLSPVTLRYCISYVLTVLRISLYFF